MQRQHLLEKLNAGLQLIGAKMWVFTLSAIGAIGDAAKGLGAGLMHPDPDPPLANGC